MTANLLPDPPERTAGDLVHVVAKSAVSAVPVAGGPAAELLAYVIGPPLSKRMDSWYEQLADAVRTLQRQQVPVDSDEFVSAVVTASRIALGTHLDEKIAMLKAAVIKCALPDRPSDILTMRFLRLIEELDVEHFVMLGFLRDPADYYERNGIEQPNVVSTYLGAVFDRAQIHVTQQDPGSARPRRSSASRPDPVDNVDKCAECPRPEDYASRQPVARLRDVH